LQTHDDFSIFQDGPATILDFQKLGISALGRAKRVKMHHHAKFCDDWSNHCQDMVI